MRAGYFNAKIEDVGAGTVMLGESKQKGTPYIEAYFVVQEGDCKGQRVRWQGWFSETVLSNGETVADQTIKALQLCGWDGDDLGEFDDKCCHGLNRNVVQIKVESEDREGKTYFNVKFVNEPRRQGVKTENAIASSAAKSLGERFRGSVRANKANREKELEFPPPQGNSQSGPTKAF